MIRVPEGSTVFRFYEYPNGEVYIDFRSGNPADYLWHTWEDSNWKSINWAMNANVDDKDIEEEVISLDLLPGTGLCKHCKNRCELKDLLSMHRPLMEKYGTTHYEREAPAEWSEFAIDEPEYTGKNNITWCPVHI